MVFRPAWGKKSDHYCTCQVSSKRIEYSTIMKKGKCTRKLLVSLENEEGLSKYDIKSRKEKKKIDNVNYI